MKSQDVKSNVKEKLNGTAKAAESYANEGRKFMNENMESTKQNLDDASLKMKSKAEDVKRAAKSKADDLGDSVEDRADDAKSTIRSAADKIKEKLSDDDFLKKAEKTASAYAQETLDFVRKYSLYTAIGASIVGLGVGYMIYRSMSESSRPDGRTMPNRARM